MTGTFVSGVNFVDLHLVCIDRILKELHTLIMLCVLCNTLLSVKCEVYKLELARFPHYVNNLKMWKYVTLITIFEKGKYSQCACEVYKVVTF
jgi:hypothetical protein